MKGITSIRQSAALSNAVARVCIHYPPYSSYSSSVVVVVLSVYIAAVAAAGAPAQVKIVNFTKWQSINEYTPCNGSFIAPVIVIGD